MYKLLVVDDEILIRNGLSNIIPWKQLGFELVGAVENASLALKIMDEEDIDVLLTDISMPEMNGLELTNIVKKKNPKLKTVIISGYNEFDYAVQAIKLKVETYILKPIDPKKIIETFEKLKVSLDEEQENERKNCLLQSKYELMRILYGDIKSMKVLFENQGEKKNYRMLLFQLLPKDNVKVSKETVEKLQSDLRNSLKGCLCRNTEELYAILALSTKSEDLLKCIKSILENDCNFNFKLVMSLDFSELSEVMDRYLSAVNSLENISMGEVRISHISMYSQEGYLFETYFGQLTRMIEDGQCGKVNETIDRLFVRLQQNQGLNPFEICTKILNNIMLYFTIDSVSHHNLNKLIDQHSSINEIEQRDIIFFEMLKTAFTNDLKNLTECIKNNSERMAILISHQARQLIKDNYNKKDLSLKYIAEELKVSYGYLSTIFAKTFGMNFITYLSMLRTEKARELLIKRKLKIYEIANSVGYSSSRYFTDVFKKRYGLSPADYLKRISNSSEETKGEVRYEEDNITK